MNDLPPVPFAHPRSRWAWPLAWVVIALVLAAAVVFVAKMVNQAPGTLLSQARSVAEAFHQGTVRTEFVSQAVSLEGTNRLQLATLKQREIFKREDSDSFAWGLVALPTVVVEAHASVEYTYFVDLAGAWEFQEHDGQVLVVAPALQANPPAVDVSALKFYTLEGSIWRDDGKVRDKLRQSLTSALAERALENRKLVREVARVKVAEFVEKWFTDHFRDGARTPVRVVFLDEKEVKEEAGGKAKH